MSQAERLGAKMGDAMNRIVDGGWSKREEFECSLSPAGLNALLQKVLPKVGPPSIDVLKSGEKDLTRGRTVLEGIRCTCVSYSEYEGGFFGMWATRYFEVTQYYVQLSDKGGGTNMVRILTRTAWRTSDRDEVLAPFDPANVGPDERSPKNAPKVAHEIRILLENAIRGDIPA